MIFFRYYVSLLFSGSKYACVSTRQEISILDTA